MLDSAVAHEGDVECRRLRMVPGFVLWVDLALCNCICD